MGRMSWRTSSFSHRPPRKVKRTVAPFLRLLAMQYWNYGSTTQMEKNMEPKSDVMTLGQLFAALELLVKTYPDAFLAVLTYTREEEPPWVEDVAFIRVEFANHGNPTVVFATRLP